MNDSTALETGSSRNPLRSWLWRILKWTSLLVLLGILYGLIARAYFASQADKKYYAVVTNLDAVDPDWRWETILAKRETIHDEDNSALLVVAAAKLLPNPETWSPRLSRKTARVEALFPADIPGKSDRHPRRVLVPAEPSKEFPISMSF